MMRARRLAVAGIVLSGVLSASFQPAGAASFEQRPAGQRAAYTALAVIANLVPGVSALYVPLCLPGYIVCKISFAGISVLAAADQLLLSGGEDLHQPRATLSSGFGGDWFLTGRHVAGDAEPQPYPEAAAPPPTGRSGGFEPPPL